MNTKEIQIIILILRRWHLSDVWSRTTSLWLFPPLSSNILGLQPCSAKYYVSIRLIWFLTKPIWSNAIAVINSCSALKKKLQNIPAPAKPSVKSVQESS